MQDSVSRHKYTYTYYKYVVRPALGESRRLFSAGLPAVRGINRSAFSVQRFLPLGGFSAVSTAQLIRRFLPPHRSAVQRLALSGFCAAPRCLPTSAQGRLPFQR